MTTTNSSLTSIAGYEGRLPAADYEQRLRHERGWAMDEGHRFFQGDSLAHHSLRRIAKRLNDLQVPYAVADGMASFITDTSGSRPTWIFL